MIETKKYNYSTPEDVAKPWGAEQFIVKTEKYVGKILHVKAGEKLSIQHHNLKEETMMVLSGKIIMHHGSEAENLDQVILSIYDCFHIPPKLIHSVEAIEDSAILEISTPELDDIVRHQDLYGRS